MPESLPEQTNTEVQDALTSIRESGDFIDRDRALRHPVGYVATTATFGLPSAVVGLSSDMSYVNLGSFANILYVPVLVGSIAATRAVRGRRRVNAALKNHDTVTDALEGEPVDIVRLPKKDGLALRWYGMDNSEDTEPSAELIERAKMVGDFAKEHGIEYVLSSASFFKDLPDDARGSGWDTLSAAKNKRLPYTELVDYASDDVVAVQTAEDFVARVSALETTQETSLVTAIVRQLQDPHLARHYAAYNQNPDNPYTKQLLSRSVRTALERETGSTESIGVRHEDGSIERIKASSTTIAMRGDRLMKLTSLPATPATTGRLATEMTQLSKLNGHSTTKEMIAALQTGDLHRKGKVELLSALHILLDYSHQFEAETLVVPDAADSKATGIPSFTERWHTQDDTAERRFKRDTLRFAKKCGAGVLAVAFGLAAGRQLLETGNDAYERESLRYEAWAKQHPELYDDETGFHYINDENYDTYRADNPGLASEVDAQLYDKIFDMQESQYTVAYHLLDTLIGTVGAEKLSSIAQNIPGFSEENLRDWAEKSALEIPMSMETLNSGESFIGDADTDSNKVVYTATALKSGGTTEGYWYGDMYNILVANGGTSPFTGTGVSLIDAANSQEDIETQHNLNIIEALDPDYMVETPYIGVGGNDDITYWNGLTLPVLQGTRLVGIRVYDKSSGASLPVEVKMDTATGLYVAVLNSYVNEVTAVRYEQPVLQYWLKESFDSKPTIHRASPMSLQFERNKRHNIAPKQDVEYVASSVRRALGLADNASISEIAKAVSQGPLYSYTPFDRQGTTKIPVTEADNTKALAQLGIILAKLDYMNCNVASMTTILATLDRKAINQATGFHDDGDGKLTQLESHAWLIDGNSTIIDPTPTEMAPGEITPKPQDTPADADGGPLDGIDGEDLQRGAEVLVAAAIGFMAWRRRKAIQTAADTVRSHAALSLPGMQHAAAIVQAELYSRNPSDAITAARIPKIATTPQSYNFAIPSRPVSLKSGTVGDKVRRQIIRLNDGAIRRQAQRSNEP